jgi:hypothetical protein
MGLAGATFMLFFVCVSRLDFAAFAAPSFVVMAGVFVAATGVFVAVLVTRSVDGAGFSVAVAAVSVVLESAGAVSPSASDMGKLPLELATE